MKNSIFSVAFIAILLGFSNLAYSQATPPKDKLIENLKVSKSSQEVRQKLEKGVQKLPNGDIRTALPRLTEDSPIWAAEEAPLPILQLLLLVDENLDFAKYNKFLKRELGDKHLVVDMLNATDKFLAPNNMHLRPTNFSATSIRQKLDKGVPFYLGIKKSDSALTEIKKRTESRESVSDMNVWKKDLRKTTIKTINKEAHTITPVLLCGYNKTSNEYLINYLNKDYWFTEAELKQLLDHLYELRM